MNPFPLLTSDNFPLRNRLAAVVVVPFDPACRMFNSAPPGNRASSEALLLLLFRVVVVLLLAELPLTNNLCN